MQTHLIRMPPRVWAEEFVLTETPRPGEAAAAVFVRLADAIAAADATLLSMMIFGPVAARSEVEAGMRRALGETHWPVTWVDGASCGGAALAGVQAFAVSRRTVARVRIGNIVVGSVYEDGDARHCLFGGLLPTSLALRPPAQVQQLFGNLQWALEAAGFELRDVVRTWFYNDRIVDWYDEFNRVRNAHYAGVPWRTGSLPASTAIGARNPAGAALTMAAWAVRPLDRSSCAQEVGSPLQCPAPAYGSAFSRAVEIASGGWRRLLVSGTASIDPDGRTAWIGDARRQIDLTMDVLAAILRERGMSFADVTRATAYCERPECARFFAGWCAEHEWQTMPAVVTRCDICRADLLFELELDACVAGSHRTKSAQQRPTAA